MTTVEPRTAAGPVPHLVRRGPMRSVRSYIALTKPRVIELLLVTTLPTMILAQQGMPSWQLVIATLAGGTLAAGSANALNCVYDRDIDVVMHRTENRPLATGEITPFRAMVFAGALGMASMLVLGLAVNVLSAALAFAAIAFYVIVYTMMLKRRTPQNIVWGGAAGCMPVLIGWSAVTNSLTWAPVVLFGVIFLWTPPHYWPLAMRYREDYDRAGVPMLTVVESPVGVARKIIAYSWAMVACSLLLWPVAHTGIVYLVVAVVAGGAFLLEAHRLHARAVAHEPALGAMRLFHLSITYLSLLFVAVAVDPFLHLPVPGL